MPLSAQSKLVNMSKFIKTNNVMTAPSVAVCREKLFKNRSNDWKLPYCAVLNVVMVIDDIYSCREIKGVIKGVTLVTIHPQ